MHFHVRSAAAQALVRPLGFQSCMPPWKIHAEFLTFWEKPAAQNSNAPKTGRAF
jgi:hypothetical protein